MWQPQFFFQKLGQFALIHGTTILRSYQYHCHFPFQWWIFAHFEDSKGSPFCLEVKDLCTYTLYISRTNTGTQLCTIHSRECNQRVECKSGQRKASVTVPMQGNQLLACKLFAVASFSPSLPPNPPCRPCPLSLRQWKTARSLTKTRKVGTPKSTTNWYCA